MKLFFVNTNQHWGGGEKWHFDTASALKNKGHDVSLLCRPGTVLHQKSALTGIRTLPAHISNLSFLNPFRLYSFNRLFRRENPGAVILNFSADIKTAGVAARCAGIRDIIYRRGNAKPIRNSFFNRWLFKKVISRIIVNSGETRNAILQNNPGLFPENRIKVIYNGIDVQAFDHLRDDRLYQRKSNEVIIGAAGRLSPEKGQKFLVEMAARLKQHHIPFTLLIAGEGPLKHELKKLIREAGLDDQVIFTGFIENIKAFMSTIDIFVLPSLWEGFGYVTVEAMACRKPVVAFRVGSNPEIILDSITGYLVKGYDVAALSEKMNLLIGDPMLRESFGKAGRKRVEEVFSMSRSVQEIEQYLAGL